MTNLQPLRDDHPSRYTMADLNRRSLHNTILNQCLAAHRHGYFLSFEECLITTICHMADQNEELLKKMTDMVMRETKIVAPQL